MNLSAVSVLARLLYYMHYVLEIMRLALLLCNEIILTDGR